MLTPKHIRRFIAGGIIALVLLIAGCGSIFSVDQTELGNVRRFGAPLYAQPLGPGLHFKAPLIDTDDVMRVTLQTIHIKPFDVLTVDNQKVSIEENFNYTISKDRFYHVMYEVGSAGHLDQHTIEQQIEPVARDRTARIFAAHNMVTVNSNREAIQAEIEKNVTIAAETLFGITTHSLQIAAITPSPSFMKSIDEATMAKNAAIAAENELRGSCGRCGTCGTFAIRECHRFKSAQAGFSITAPGEVPHLPQVPQLDLRRPEAAMPDLYCAQQAAATAKGGADAAIEAARGQAESRRRTADAEAYARTANATAEASAVEAVGLATAKSLKAQTEALRASPELVDYTKANRWNGALPAAIYGTAPIPFLNVSPSK